MRTIDETAAAILEPPKGMLVVDEYAEALVGADRAHRFTEAVLAVLLTPEAFAALRPRGSRPLIGVRMTTPEIPLAHRQSPSTSTCSRAIVPPH